MPKLKYDHPVIQKGAVQVFAHLVQKQMSANLLKVRTRTNESTQRPGRSLSRQDRTAVASVKFVAAGSSVTPSISGSCNFVFCSPDVGGFQMGRA